MHAKKTYNIDLHLKTHTHINFYSLSLSINKQQNKDDIYRDALKRILLKLCLLIFYFIDFYFHLKKYIKILFVTKAILFIANKCREKN